MPVIVFKIMKVIYLVISISFLLSWQLKSISYAEEQESHENTSTSEKLAQNDESDDITTEEVTIAPNLDLKEVAPPPEPVVIKPKEVKKLKSEVKKDKDAAVTSSTNEKNYPKATAVKEKPEREKLVILGSEVPPNTSTRLAWSPQVTISGLALPTPVLVINGAKPGPTICLTGAIHGDELHGIEVIRRVMYDISPAKLSGTLIGVPIVNLQGFQRGSRYLSDRRDLNRYFPGEANGSLASRIAHSLFTEVIQHCEYLIDIHTGSLRRTNLPHIRANMLNPKVAEFVKSFDKIAIVHHRGNSGMLRTAANEAGIIAITLELGESLRIQKKQIEAGTYSVNSLLDKLDMYPRAFIWGDPEPQYYKSTWVRADSGGILFSKRGLGDIVEAGDTLGTVTDPITNKRVKLKSPIDGHIIGMAVNQVVVPGFAAYHIGIESSQEDIANTDEEPPLDLNPDGEHDPE
jgi:predicted deacylase